MESFKNPIFGEFYFGSDSSYSGWKVARLKYYGGQYFGYDRSSDRHDLSVDEKFCSDYSSFRMMKVPEESE